EEQAVRDGVAHEVERARGHEPRHDAHLLHAAEEEKGPEVIDELGGEQQHAEGRAGGGPLRREPDAVVTEEHRASWRWDARLTAAPSAAAAPWRRRARGAPPRARRGPP